MNLIVDAALAGARRQHHLVRVHHDGEWYHVYCFSDPADANKFKEQFGGEKFKPDQRGKGRQGALE
jgi:hypothetical protein